MFTTGEDGNLELLTRDATLKHPALVYGQAPYYPADPPTSGGACLGLNPYAGPYYLATMTSQGIPIQGTIYQLSVGTSSSSSSGASPDRDSTEDYLEIGGSCYRNPAIEGHLINMVAPAPSGNIFSRYPTIGRSEASDARTPDNRLVRDLNPNFNIVRLQIIMESIQCMAP
jgi:hypothetical protein